MKDNTFYMITGICIGMNVICVLIGIRDSNYFGAAWAFSFLIFIILSLLLGKMKGYRLFYVILAMIHGKKHKHKTTVLREIGNDLKSEISAVFCNDCNKIFYEDNPLRVYEYKQMMDIVDEMDKKTRRKK